MSVTVTSAADRERRRNANGVRALSEHHLLLALTSLVAVLAMSLSYYGRLTSAAATGPSAELTSTTNLNAVADARDLEASLAAIVASPLERRSAAAHLYEFVRARRQAGALLPNVGAILAARDSDDVALLTASDLAVLKPRLVVRTADDFRTLALRWAVVYFTAIWAVALLWRARAFRGDYLLLSAAHLLTAIGFAVVLSRSDPLRDTLLFIRYTQGVVIGLLVFGMVSLVNVRKATSLTLSYLPLAGALLLCVMLIVFGSGPVGSNAKVNLGPMQPIEATRLLLALFLAGYFATRWEVLRELRGRTIREVRLPRWLGLPRADYVLPVVIGIAAVLIFFFLQRDLGPALVVSCVFLAMYALARGAIGMAVVGMAMLSAGFYVGHLLNVSATLTARVDMWRSAWDNDVRGGEQIAQAVWAASTGGMFGTGLGLGDTRYLPAGHTDLVLAAIGEELGFVGLVSVGAIFALIAAHGFRTGARAAHAYGFFLATAVTLFLVVPVLVMAAGMLGVMPLTGVVTPFLSYGGSAMVANFAALGILAAIRAAPGDAGATLPFRPGLQGLVSLMSVAAVALIAILLNVQVLNADEYVVKPHLGLQGDGARRYQYNQRILDVLGRVRRGTVYDRNGLPLATSDAAVARDATELYRKRGITLDTPCLTPVEERCYPLAGATFHLLGDASRRTNWGARNTSYVERDAQHRLRGFDDRAAAAAPAEERARSAPASRRDYRELIPLLRHRFEDDHPDVKAFLDRPRDLTLTIDAPLQARVARILSKYAARSANGRVAAVVLDAQTGNLLASVSYPFPESGAEQPVQAGDAHEVLLDRARYGLYPPGSTFKLVTAIAALRQDDTAARQSFMCSLLPGGRVGATIQGWGPIRDDVLDAHPHGRISMHDAMAQSCNAYFAQLAVDIDAQPLFDTAALAGISVAENNSLNRLRATLPHAAYGQGDVVATPLRMARMMAAVASDGVLRESRLEDPVSPASQLVLLKPGAAATLRQSLRDAVVRGTGRTLRNHPWRIAGKTGTAEVGGAPSHAWFVGYAPHGSAARQIAFAVIVEHAGYGGSAAAAAAGEIVSAAATSGLVR